MNHENRRAMLKAYKETPRRFGVYLIRNLANGKVLVQGCINPQAALNRHRFELQLGTHRLRSLQRDWRAHGAGAFEFTVLDLIKPRDEPDFDYQAQVQALADIWCNELGFYGEAGYR